MKISTRGRYSLRMMIDLAENYDKGFIALKDISQRQGISKKYLEQIIPFLNRSGLLLTNRGHMGGYQLARDPSSITAFEILESAEGNLVPVSCMEADPVQCGNCDTCAALSVYRGLYKVTSDYLKSITLQSLICNAKNGGDYSI